MSRNTRGAAKTVPSQPTVATTTRSSTDKPDQESELINASTRAASKICDSITLVNTEFMAICKDTKDISQRIEALKAVKDLVCSNTAHTAVQVGRIYAEKSSKKLEAELMQQQSSVVLNGPSIKQTATAYKLTFKPINLTSDRSIIKPIDELYDATGHFPMQILDSYNTPNGHVVCIQTREMFLAAKTALLTHLVNDEKPLTEYFEIRDQIVSAYSIKTDNFDKDILTKRKLTILENNQLVLNVKDTIKFLQQYNSGWFPNEGDIENIEAFNLNKPESKVSLKIHVSLATFNNFLASLTTKIMLYDEGVRVYEQIPVTQCMRCCGFGHIASLCTSQRAHCRFCGSDEKGDNGHRSKDCPKRSTPTCCNCLAAGTTGDDAKHPATSFACKLLKREADILRKNAKSKKCANFMFN